MSAEREIAAEDSIRVVCRFRPLNDSEEKAGSKFIVKFPNNQEENCISIAVSKAIITIIINCTKKYGVYACSLEFFFPFSLYLRSALCVRGVLRSHRSMLVMVLIFVFVLFAAAIS